jgi:hypothetical protein
MHRIPRPLVALALLAALAGCGGGGGTKTVTQPVPVGDAIIIASLSPAEGTRLAPGGKVNFQVTANYRLVSAATGTVALVIVDQGGNDIPNGQVGVNVTQGEASVQLSAEVTIPATGVTAIQLVCALHPTGNPSEIVQSNVNYIVGT